MFRLAVKNYYSNIGYNFLIIIQMVIVLTVLNIHFLGASDTYLSVENIEFENERLYYLSSVLSGEDFQDEGKTDELKPIEKIVGKEKVGYLKINDTLVNDKNIACKTIYLNPVMEKIKYRLKSGEWFHGEKKSVILGGEIAKHYKTGDKIMIEKQDGETYTTNVIGKMKEPAKVLLLDCSASDLQEMLIKRNSIILTNDEEIVSGYGEEMSYVSVTAELDFASEKRQLKELEKYCCADNLSELKQEAMQNVKNELAESVAEDTVMILIAFLSVAINIFLFIQKNKKAIGIYTVLGMEKRDIYGMVCLQSVINISIADFVILLLYQYKSFRHDMLGEYHLSVHNFIVTVIFIMMYLLVTAATLGMTLRKKGR